METLAQIDKHQEMFGETPLHVAATGEIAQDLLDAGAKVDATTHDCETPLHFAASEGRSGVVERLLAGGADPTSCDDRGQTPLHKAASSTSADSHTVDAKNNGTHHYCLTGSWCTKHTIEHSFKNNYLCSGV